MPAKIPPADVLWIQDVGTGVRPTASVASPYGLLVHAAPWNYTVITPGLAPKSAPVLASDSAPTPAQNYIVDQQQHDGLHPVRPARHLQARCPPQEGGLLGRTKGDTEGREERGPPEEGGVQGETKGEKSGIHRVQVSPRRSKRNPYLSMNMNGNKRKHTCLTHTFQ